MKIKDLDPNKNLRGVKFHDPKTGTIGYWYSQWGYADGKAGIWFKKTVDGGDGGHIYPLFLNDLKEALEFEVIEGV